MLRSYDVFLHALRHFGGHLCWSVGRGRWVHWLSEIRDLNTSCLVEFSGNLESSQAQCLSSFRSVMVSWLALTEYRTININLISSNLFLKICCLTYLSEGVDISRGYESTLYFTRDYSIVLCCVVFFSLSILLGILRSTLIKSRQLTVKRTSRSVNINTNTPWYKIAL